MGLFMLFLITLGASSAECRASDARSATVLPVEKTHPVVWKQTRFEPGAFSSYVSRVEKRKPTKEEKSYFPDYPKGHERQKKANSEFLRALLKFSPSAAKISFIRTYSFQDGMWEEFPLFLFYADHEKEYLKHLNVPTKKHKRRLERIANIKCLNGKVVVQRECDSVFEIAAYGDFNHDGYDDALVVSDSDVGCAFCDGMDCEHYFDFHVITRFKDNSPLELDSKWRIPTFKQCSLFKF